MRIVLPVLGVFLVGFAALCLYLFKEGLDSYLTSRSISSVQIDAPEGWDMQPYIAAHGEEITGDVYLAVPGQPSTTDDILLAFENAAAGTDDGIAWTFRNGDQLVALRMRIAPYVKPRVSMAERLGYEAPAEPPAPDPDTILGAVDGVAIREMPRFADREGDPLPEPVNYRHFVGQIGETSVSEALEMSILTNASDAAVAQVLDRLDMAALNEKLKQPDDHVAAGRGFVPSASEPLSDVPPPPTPAYSALQMLRTAVDLPSKDREILMRVREGEINNWDALQAAYPKIDDVSFEVLRILDDGAPANTARYYASILANSGREWNTYEHYLLSAVARGGSSQADLGDYLDSGFDVAPEITALIDRLPLESTVSPDAVAAEPSGGFQSGCRIEGGIRRCVVNNN